MLANEAVSEVFYTAFKSLDRSQKADLLRHMLEDREFREDLFDLSLMEQARKTPGRPVSAQKYFAARRARK
jgi:hypothetical protein